MEEKKVNWGRVVNRWMPYAISLINLLLPNLNLISVKKNYHYLCNFFFRYNLFKLLIKDRCNLVSYVALRLQYPVLAQVHVL